MRITTWNVNSVKARLPHLLAYLRSPAAPDVLLLQEVKCQEEGFPYLEVGDCGYNIRVAGQKTYNGVAILAKSPIEDVVTVLPGTDPAEARYIEALVGTVRVASVYVPMGTEVGCERYAVKLNFMEAVFQRLRHLLRQEEVLVMGGDYNIAPEELDVWDAKALEGHVLFNPDLRAAWRKILWLGVSDAFRALHPDEQAFSWWDYRAGAFQRGLGMRIDHLLLSPQAADRLKAAGIDAEERARDKASDHAPAWCNLA